MVYAETPACNIYIYIYSTQPANKTFLEETEESTYWKCHIQGRIISEVCKQILFSFLFRDCVLVTIYALLIC